MKANLYLPFLIWGLSLVFGIVSGQIAANLIVIINEPDSYYLWTGDSNSMRRAALQSGSVHHEVKRPGDLGSAKDCYTIMCNTDMRF
jgi:hypothetical protein